MVTPAEPAGLFAAFLQLALGLVLAFAGYPIARALAGLAGFLGGAAIGLVVGTTVGGPPVGLVAALVLGILLAILAHVALRLLAAFLAGGFAVTLALAFGLAGWLVVLLAIVVGALGLFAHRVVLILATAANGAVLAAGAGVFLLDRWGVALPEDELAFLVAALALAALGIVVQWRAARE